MQPVPEPALETPTNGMRIPAKVFVSAGESSGDLYASALVQALQRHWPAVEWFGCAGPRMQQTGVKPIVDSRSLSVVGLVEVIGHLPRIYGEYRKLVRAIREQNPDFVILTDSPDFHLRLAAKVHAMGIPVIYLVAPQAWAWRQGRVKQMRKTVSRLLCLFPFEEDFYRQRGVRADYIGHPLARLIRPQWTKTDFLARHKIPAGRPVVALCPGSRRSEIVRHLDPLIDAVGRIRAELDASFVLASPLGFSQAGEAVFKELISGAAIQVVEGETWDVLCHSDLALAASGTVTMEAALLGTPLITYYKVTPLSWMLGRLLVRVPYYSMVNLIAGRRLAPELMQNEMTGQNLAREAVSLLEDLQAREVMRQGLKEVSRKLSIADDPMERAARLVREFFDEYTFSNEQASQG